MYGQAAINTTIRPVFCAQFVQPNYVAMGLRFIALTYGPPRNYFYGICGAPYWNAGGELPAGTTTAQAVAALDQAIPGNDGNLQTGTATALFYGLHNFTYEGGPSNVSFAMDGDSGGVAAQALEASVQMAPGMKADVIQGLTRAFANGIDMYMYYENESATLWGATTDPLDLNAPKFAGLTATAGQLVTRNAGTALPGTIVASNPNFGVTGDTLVPMYLATGSNCHPDNDQGPALCAFNNTTAVGTGTGYLVNVPKAGNYTFSIVMDTTQTIFAGSVELDVDQKSAGTLTFPRTAAGASLTLGPVTVSLSTGLHLIELLNAGNGQYAVDSIEVHAN